jgi:hypothetical protein
MAYDELDITDFYLLPGIELSSIFEGASVHILGYAFHPQNPVMRTFCDELRGNRRARNHAILGALRESGILLREEDFIMEGGLVRGRPHIARAMWEKGYVSSPKEAFRRYIGDGAPCYVQGVKFSAQEVIDLIHKAGGFAVLAHPHLMESPAIVEKLLDLNFDGIECYYANFSKKMNQKWVEAAREHNFFTTGGSDFHGEGRVGIDLGASVAPADTFWKLWNHFKQVGA